MMPNAQQFPFVDISSTAGSASRLPYLPVSLELNQATVAVSALLDTGAAVNVLPFDVGLQLGANWNQQTIPIQLRGNLAQSEARALIVSGIVAQFAPVRLAFAWTRNNAVPVILGQVNFFLEFDVCFFRARSLFEVKPK